MTKNMNEISPICMFSRIRKYQADLYGITNTP